LDAFTQQEVAVVGVVNGHDWVHSKQRDGALIPQFSELHFGFGKFPLELREPFDVIVWSAVTGTASFDGILALHDLPSQAFHSIEKSLLRIVPVLRTVHARHHNKDAGLLFAVVCCCTWVTCCGYREERYG
jgi:hypothetical protein